MPVGTHINDEGALNLMNAVVMRAVRDYDYALYKFNTARKPEERQNAGYAVELCEKFFRRGLGAYCTLDGEEIILHIQANVREKLSKKRICMEVPNDNRRVV